jgi:hypothetical protein
VVEISSLKSFLSYKYKMDAKKLFKAFVNDLKMDFPETEFKYTEDSISEFEELITPKILKILQRDKSLFHEPFESFEQDLSTHLRSFNKLEKYWKHIQSCAFASFLSGDIKGKLSKFLDSFKEVLGGRESELDKVLGSEESRSKVSEIMEFVMTTKLAKVVTSLVETIDISSLGIDFENPEDMMRSIQEPSNKIMETVMKKVKEELDTRLRRGDFTKEQLMRDIENIKVKIQEAFGDMFNDMLGGRKAEVPTAAILGNTPEARRARMMARLRRKVGEMKNPQ